MSLPRLAQAGMSQVAPVGLTFEATSAEVNTFLRGLNWS
jgi:hypothetical protein